MKTILLLASILLVLPASTQAAWWLRQLHVSPQQERIISDDPIQFRLGDMPCGVTKTELHRTDGFVTESRILYCRTAKDTEVSIIVNCSYPNYVMQGLTIQKGSIQYYPALICGPEKKP
jgi:hypothetical protein